MVEDTPAGEGASTTTPLFTKIGFDGEEKTNARRLADKLPDPIGWKKWKVGDWFGNIEKDRTPIPHGGRFEHPDDGGLSGGAGTKYVEGKVLSNKVEELMNTGTNCYNPVKYPELSIAHHLSRRYTTPYLKTFFTDLGANIINMQSGPCMDFEINALECIEYYGAKQGLTACKDWYDDYIECTHKTKQNLRVKAMYKKRHVDNHLEYLQGKRTYAETYEAPPKAHAYTEPWFDAKFAHLQQKEH